MHYLSLNNVAPTVGSLNRTLPSQSLPPPFSASMGDERNRPWVPEKMCRPDEEPFIAVSPPQGDKVGDVLGEEAAAFTSPFISVLSNVRLVVEHLAIFHELEFLLAKRDDRAVLLAGARLEDEGVACLTQHWKQLLRAVYFLHIASKLADSERGMTSGLTCRQHMSAR